MQSWELSVGELFSPWVQISPFPLQSQLSPLLLLILILPVQLMSLLLSLWKFFLCIVRTAAQISEAYILLFLSPATCLPLCLELDTVVGHRPILKNSMVSLRDVLPTK